MKPRKGTAPTVDCPVCGAAVGERCRGNRGPVDYHYGRRELAQRQTTPVTDKHRYRFEQDDTT